MKSEHNNIDSGEKSVESYKDNLIKTFKAVNKKLEKENSELKEALKGVIDLIDSSDLVRDITNDADNEHFTKQALRIGSAMAKVVKVQRDFIS